MLQLQCSNVTPKPCSCHVHPQMMSSSVHIFIFWPQLTALANSVYIWLVKSLTLYLDCIYNDRTLMLLDAEIYITVYIISSLVLRPPPFLPFNWIHNSTQKWKTAKNGSSVYCECKQETREQGYIILRLLSSFWDIVQAQTNPSVDHFQHSGNETSLLPHINFTLTMIIHHSQFFCVLLSTHETK